MEEENIGGSKRGHDPDQPAHVTRPGTQLTQVEPKSQRNKANKKKHNFSVSNVHTDTCTHVRAGPGCLPRGVGGGNEEINHHPVTHVETVLHRPAERPESLVTTE